MRRQATHPKRQHGSVLIVVLSLTTAIATIVVTRLALGIDRLRIDQNSLIGVQARNSMEIRMREIERSLGTEVSFENLNDRSSETLVHAWIEPTSSDGTIVDYFGCSRLAEVALAVCDDQDTQGLAVHVYRISLRMNTVAGVMRTQSIYHAHRRIEHEADTAKVDPAPVTAEGEIQTLQSETRNLLPSGRVSWIAY